MCMCFGGSRRATKYEDASTLVEAVPSVTSPSATKLSSCRVASTALSGLLSFISNNGKTRAAILDVGQDSTPRTRLGRAKTRVDIVQVTTAKYLEMLTPHKDDTGSGSLNTSHANSPVPLADGEHAVACREGSELEVRRAAESHDSVAMSREYVPSRLSHTRVSPQHSQRTMRNMGLLCGGSSQQQLAVDASHPHSQRSSHQRRATRTSDLLTTADGHGAGHSPHTGGSNSPFTTTNAPPSSSKAAHSQRLAQTGRSRSDRIQPSPVDPNLAVSSHLGRAHTTALLAVQSTAGSATSLAAALHEPQQVASTGTSLTSRLDSHTTGTALAAVPERQPSPVPSGAGGGAGAGPPTSQSSPLQQLGPSRLCMDTHTTFRDAARQSMGDLAATGPLPLSSMPTMAAVGMAARSGGIYFSRDDVHVTGLPYDQLLHHRASNTANAAHRRSSATGGGGGAAAAAAASPVADPAWRGLVSQPHCCADACGPMSGAYVQASGEDELLEMIPTLHPGAAMIPVPAVAGDAQQAQSEVQLLQQQQHSKRCSSPCIPQLGTVAAQRPPVVPRSTAVASAVLAGLPRPSPPCSTAAASSSLPSFHATASRQSNSSRLLAGRNMSVSGSLFGVSSSCLAGAGGPVSGPLNEPANGIDVSDVSAALSRLTEACRSVQQNPDARRQSCEVRSSRINVIDPQAAGGSDRSGSGQPMSAGASSRLLSAHLAGNGERSGAERLGVIVGRVVEEEDEGASSTNMTGTFVVATQPPAVPATALQGHSTAGAAAAAKAAAMLPSPSSAAAAHKLLERLRTEFVEVDEHALHSDEDDEGDEGEVVFKYEGFSILGRQESLNTSPVRHVQPRAPVLLPGPGR